MLSQSAYGSSMPSPSVSDSEELDSPLVVVVLLSAMPVSSVDAAAVVDSSPAVVDVVPVIEADTVPAVLSPVVPVVALVDNDVEAPVWTLLAPASAELSSSEKHDSIAMSGRVGAARDMAGRLGLWTCASARVSRSPDACAARPACDHQSCPPYKARCASRPSPSRVSPHRRLARAQRSQLHRPRERQ